MCVYLHQNGVLEACALCVPIYLALRFTGDLSVKLHLKQKIYYKFISYVQRKLIACCSSSDQRNNSSEAVEELKYRRSLKIALDILNQNVSPREVPPSEEGPNTQLSRENKAGSLSSTPLRRCQSLFHSKEKLEPETFKKKRKQKNNPRLKTDTKKQTQKASLILEESAKAHERGTNPSKCSTGDLCNTSNSDSQNCKIPESESLPKQKRIKPGLLTKSQIGNKVALRPKEEKSEQGRKRRGAGSPVSHRTDFPRDQAQPLAEGGSLLSVPCQPDTVVPVRRANTRSQPKRTLLDSSCKSASDDLEKSISSESESLAKQLSGRKKPVSLKRINGEQETGVTLSPYRKRKCRSCPESSPGPSNRDTLSDSFPSQHKEEENKNTSHMVMNKVKQFQLPDFEEDEGGHIAWGREIFIPFDCRALLLILGCCIAFVNEVPKLLISIPFVFKFWRSTKCSRFSMGYKLVWHLGCVELFRVLH